MTGVPAAHWEAWAIAGMATTGVILRPFGWPEYVWALGGAVLLVGFGVLPASDALTGAARGGDVYLFLTGMMLLSEVARQAGLFDWLAARAVRLARGSAGRLFALVFAVGTLVTVFLSNDATAVVLTPAVAAAARTARVRDPLPYLFVCAFVANAASFVLPISNPANLVIYASRMPPLANWLPTYAWPSLLAVGATYAVLRWTQRASLAQAVASDIDMPALAVGGRMAALGIAATACVLLAASAFDVPLGLPTFLAGVATAGLVLVWGGTGPLAVAKGVSWGVLPLVAGLFVLVEALQRTGVTDALAALLHGWAERSAQGTGWTAGIAVAFGCNLVNNLPMGLVAGRVVAAGQVPDQIRQAVLVGVDLGPNLSVTGSLATILWLTALRREEHNVGAWRFLRLGALVMPPALLLALAGVTF